MNEELFWKIIEESRKDGLEKIGERLSDMTKSDILEFHEFLAALLVKAYVFPILAANFVIESYVSDQGFRTFRAWLVLQGRKSFFDAISDSESIADWLNEDAIDGIEEGDYLLSIAEDTYGADDFHQIVMTIPDPILNQEWPDSKQKYLQNWPKLVSKFWNQKLIDEMHK